jgi:beta-glucanase (GH16 family)
MPGREPMSNQVPAEFAAWSLAWAEEFNGPAGSPADPRTWRPETGGHGWGNSELQFYTCETANAALDGAGNLAIMVARPDPQLATARYDGCQYTSARLITKDLTSFRYGLIQAKIKLPDGRGIWPAFWMLGTDIDTAGWPDCGEIDVMENFGTNPAVVHGTVHGPGYSGDGGITASLDTGAPLAAGFHVYSVCWEPGRIRWYADQALYHTVTPADLRGRPWVFDHDFYLLINVAVGGRFSQHPDRSTAFPQAMLIDYIRTYTT